MRSRVCLVSLLPGLVLAASLVHAAPAVRIKDLTEVEGVRSNPLFGYGLVVGLQGTGDGTQARFTVQSVANSLRLLGVTVPPDSIRVRNVAAVVVTAELPPFARIGQRLDVLVSSLGDAKSLQGGTLLFTPLLGADGQPRALAQGAVSLGGGFSGGGGGNSVTKNHPTVGRVPAGAVVEVPLSLDLSLFERFHLILREPDFATAQRIAAAVNGHFDAPVARPIDSGGVRLTPPENLRDDPVGLLAEIEALEVRPDVVARVAINEKTGTVVMGHEVRISRVALAHGNLTIEVSTDYAVSQPQALGEGDTVVVPQREVRTTEEPNRVLTLEEGVSVSELVEALNVLGVSARDMVAIFQAMRAAGALHAELVLL